ncbi:MAG: hypothetical protein ACQESK_08080 [Bacteroidota bacterium]
MPKTHQYIALGLFLIVSFFSLKATFYFGYYALFTENFIETYCVNVDKPELECDGKCFLGDLIDSSTSEKPDIPTYVQTEILLFFEPVSDVNFEVLTSEEQLFNYTNLYNFSTYSQCFKPPIS